MNGKFVNTNKTKLKSLKKTKLKKNHIYIPVFTDMF